MFNVECFGCQRHIAVTEDFFDAQIFCSQDCIVVADSVLAHDPLDVAPRFPF